MTKWLRNCLFLNNKKLPKGVAYALLVFLALASNTVKSQKIGNYVNNGSFEDYFMPNLLYRLPYYWSALDSSNYYGELLTSPLKVPVSSYTYQYPKHGKNHLITTPYLVYPNFKRGYPRNRLKEYLKQGRTYCVTFYVNLTDQSTHGIDAIGAYFGDNDLDTITKCNDPITYLSPQIENPTNNVITDTMNWVPITSTFVANGTEKYMLIGNYRSNANTDTTLANPTNLPANFAEYLIDAVSVIEFDLPAYAGIDKVITPGDSAFVGREPDFAIDPGCVWYQFPNMATPIAAISGLWVKPTITTTYVVRQILDCSAEKWDTVVIYTNPVGIVRLSGVEGVLEMFPIPAQDFIELRVSQAELFKEINSVAIYDNLGQLLGEQKINFENKSVQISTSDLANGIYFIRLKSGNSNYVNKRFVISR